MLSYIRTIKQRKVLEMCFVFMKTSTNSGSMSTLKFFLNMTYFSLSSIAWLMYPLNSCSIKEFTNKDKACLCYQYWLARRGWGASLFCIQEDTLLYWYGDQQTIGLPWRSAFPFESLGLTWLGCFWETMH